MAFQGGFIRRRVALVGAVRAPVLAGQSWWPFEVASSCNRHGPAAGLAR